MKKLGFMVVNKWLSYLFGSVVVVILVIPCIPKSIDAANFSCPPPLSGPPGSGDVSCLIAKINSANGMRGQHTIYLKPGSYTLQAVDNGSPFNGNGLPVISGSIRIQPTAEDLPTVIERDPNASLSFRIFEVAIGGELTLTAVTIQRGAVFPRPSSRVLLQY